ncbi:hypothetical protein HYDPIDRAFT_33347 [Hydnomerulius pinastri MD-312]|uniref:Unplaced genomic scaffold scaffold_58, whole genome shotgun sequence n=1 Tax=Hydnomerulius pinastri MD-312 TaxID=994086 RepID=A0A0C9W913_9AGAM|nr:hypothetical protein HYDPIDRAFT_33347 [Hydnomerulius pinastri MD-312]
MSTFHILAASEAQELKLLANQQIVKYCRVAPAALWTLDYLLTFEHEVRLMTAKNRWTVTHALFLMTRYFPVIGFVCAIYDAITPHLQLSACFSLYKTTGCVLFFVMLATEGLLLLRTLALWHSQKFVKIFLITVYTLAVVAMFVCIVITISLNLNSICSASSSASSLSTASKIEWITAGMFISAALFELTAICFTLYQGVRLKGSNSLGNRNRLISALTHGNLMYACSLFATSIANIVFFILPIGDGWSGLLDVFQGVLHGVLASRILFSLREADKTAGAESVAVSDMQFASAVQMSVMRNDDA